MSHHFVIYRSRYGWGTVYVALRSFTGGVFFYGQATQNHLPLSQRLFRPGGRNIADLRLPVSYTHLDVYKRQLILRPGGHGPIHPGDLRSGEAFAATLPLYLR